jgi:hypothetical protein
VGSVPACFDLNRILSFGRILFQRGVYPADDFHMVKKYGQTVLITQDLALENYLEKYLLLSHPPRWQRSHRFQDIKAN